MIRIDKFKGLIHETVKFLEEFSAKFAKFLKEFREEIDKAFTNAAIDHANTTCSCGSVSFRTRIKTNERVCLRCGKVRPIYEHIR